MIRLLSNEDKINTLLHPQSNKFEGKEHHTRGFKHLKDKHFIDSTTNSIDLKVENLNIQAKMTLTSLLSHGHCF